MGRAQRRAVVALTVGFIALALVLGTCTADEDAAEPTAATTATPSATPTTEPELLLPDITTLPASSILLEVADNGARTLRFGTTLANVGVGPIEVIPVPEAPCPANQRFFAQEIRVDADSNGSYAPDTDVEIIREDGACALFHAEHEHWHIDGSASYDLQDTVGTTLVIERKVSFCLRDTDRVPNADASTDETYGECSQDQLQGISPGWGDLYDADLAGQTLLLPESLPDDIYCLVMTADPFDYLRESDEDNNASATAIEITGDNAVRSSSSACPTV